VLFIKALTKQYNQSIILSNDEKNYLIFCIVCRFKVILKEIKVTLGMKKTNFQRKFKKYKNQPSFLLDKHFGFHTQLEVCIPHLWNESLYYKKLICRGNQ
jgi:hypothetical protein